MLSIFMKYFIHVFSIFICAPRKPENKLYRMYSLSTICGEYTWLIDVNMSNDN